MVLILKFNRTERLLNKWIIHTRLQVSDLCFLSSHRPGNSKSHWPWDVFTWSSWAQSFPHSFKPATHPTVKRQRRRVRWLAVFAVFFFPPFVFFIFYFRANSLSKVSRESTARASFTTCDSSRPRGALLRRVTMNDSLSPAWTLMADKRRVSQQKCAASWNKSTCKVTLSAKHASAHSLTSLIFHFLYFGSFSSDEENVLKVALFPPPSLFLALLRPLQSCHSGSNSHLGPSRPQLQRTKLCKEFRVVRIDFLLRKNWQLTIILFQ